MTKEVMRSKLMVAKVNSNGDIFLSKTKKPEDIKTMLHPINIINWKDYSYKPQVSFQIAHSKDAIFIKYQIKEKYILAKETQINGDVYKDSCVEFFISFDGKNYYNFEFNCIGTIHLGYGSGKLNRKFIEPEIINGIEIKSSLENQPFEEKKGNFEWEMEIKIPVSCFTFDTIKTLSGIKALANFYKCGDGTSEPHYLSWNSIGTKTPDFHRSEFFGEVMFE